MQWTNPAVERCRAELALNTSVCIFDRFHKAKIPSKPFNHQLTKCLHCHWECTRNLPAQRLPQAMWDITRKRLKLLDPYYQTGKAKNQEYAALQWVILAGVAAMLIIDVLVSCPDYYSNRWRYLSDTTDTLCNNYLFPLFPEAEEQATRLWMKVSA
jgi:hypothetical protein